MNTKNFTGRNFYQSPCVDIEVVRVVHLSLMNSEEVRVVDLSLVNSPLVNILVENIDEIAPNTECLVVEDIHSPLEVWWG